MTLNHVLPTKTKLLWHENSLFAVLHMGPAYDLLYLYCTITALVKDRIADIFK
jgi:hypothetical protein